MSQFSVKNVLSHSAEKFRRGNLLCCVSEFFWYRKILCIRGGREGGSQLLLKNFCLTEPKHSVEEPFGAVFQKISGSEKVYLWMGGGRRRREGVSWFSDEIFLSHSAEKFFAVLQKFPVAKKFMDNGGGGDYQDVPSKIFCLIVPEISVGEIFTVALISGTEKVWIRKGGGGWVVSRFSIENFLSHSDEKFRRGNLLCCVSENFR